MGDNEEEEPKKKGNALPLWGNTHSMNINNLIVTNILASPYFKNELFKLKTFHEVIDEIYYKVSWLLFHFLNFIAVSTYYWKLWSGKGSLLASVLQIINKMQHDTVVSVSDRFPYQPSSKPFSKFNRFREIWASLLVKIDFPSEMKMKRSRIGYFS